MGILKPQIISRLKLYRHTHYIQDLDLMGAENTINNIIIPTHIIVIKFNPLTCFDTKSRREREL